MYLLRLVFGRVRVSVLALVSVLRFVPGRELGRAQVPVPEPVQVPGPMSVPIQVRVRVRLYLQAYDV